MLPPQPSFYQRTQHNAAYRQLTTKDCKLATDGQWDYNQNDALGDETSPSVLNTYPQGTQTCPMGIIMCPQAIITSP